MPVQQEPIPLHNFSRDDVTSIPFRLELLTYKNKYDPSQAHRHNYYEIFFFLEGGGDHMNDFVHIPITPKSIHFVAAGQVHLVQRALNSTGYVLMFSRDFFSTNLENKDMLFELPFFNNNIALPAMTLKDELHEELHHLIREIKDEYFSEHSFREDIIRSCLNILLLKCRRIFEEHHHAAEGMDTPAKELVNRFKTLLEKNFTHLHQVSDYADHLCITPGHLNDVSKRITGKTAGTLIHERILLEARRLLLHSTLSTKEIASFLHFDDPSYFSRFFRKSTGLSPLDFRRTVREKYQS